jgi:ribose 5-phosphate isomerase A
MPSTSRARWSSRKTGSVGQTSETAKAKKALTKKPLTKGAGPAGSPQQERWAWASDSTLLRKVRPFLDVSDEQRDEQKRVAGKKAAALIAKNGLTIGMGTGSTAKHFVEALGARLQSGGLRIHTGVPTSRRTADQATGLGIPTTEVNRLPPSKSPIDIAVDGADQVQIVKNATGHQEAWLIKGGGGAAKIEKDVALLAKRFVVIVDPSKVVDKLGVGFPLPVMVKPSAWKKVKAELERLGAEVSLRPQDKSQTQSPPFLDDAGNHVLDASFPHGIDNPYDLQAKLDATKGVAAHGLFLGMTDDLIVGLSEDKTVSLQFDRT